MPIRLGNDLTPQSADEYLASKYLKENSAEPIKVYHTLFIGMFSFIYCAICSLEYILLQAAPGLAMVVMLVDGFLSIPVCCGITLYAFWSITGTPYFEREHWTITIGSTLGYTLVNGVFMSLGNLFTQSPLIKVIMLIGYFTWGLFYMGIRIS